MRVRESEEMRDEAAVRDELRKILESDGFRNSERLCRFLRYTVEAKLRGEDGQIKEYLLGREVFDRAGDYDPRLDPIVRVEARRLRQKLGEFYAASPVEPGRVRIDFPKGSYAPEFQTVDAEAAVSGPSAVAGARSRWKLAVVLVAAALVAGGLYLWMRSRAGSADLLAVIPARWTWTQEDFPSTAYDEELAELVGADLSHGREVKVVAWPLLQKYRGGGWSLRQIADDLRIHRVLAVSVRVEASGYRVTGYLMDPGQNRKLGFFDLPGQDLTQSKERRKLAAELAKRIVAAASAR